MKENKSQKFLRLKAEILNEIEALDRIHNELKQLLATSKAKSKSTFELRAFGSILHDFYCGIERIFERIAEELNGGLPEGKEWHRQLLRDMTLELKEIRPSVISEATEKYLAEYLRFRHIFRNIYGYTLEWQLMERLVENFEDILTTFKKDIKYFSFFLEKLSKA